MESVHIRGGERLVAAGHRGVPLVLVVRGGLRASFVDAHGARHISFELFRGGTVGEALLLNDSPAPFDLHAIRDSHLLCLTPDSFHEVIAKHPELVLRFAQILATRVLDLYRTTQRMPEFAHRSDRLPRNIVLLGAPDACARDVQEGLAETLARSCRTSRLGARDARQTLPADREAAGPEVEERLSEWVARHETRSDVVVFECDPCDGPWLDFGLRQADRVMVLAPAVLGRDALEAIWRQADLGSRSARVELALVHPPSTSLPRGASVYLDLPGLARLHHVRAGASRDIDRLARWLVNRPVGLVLGGGGAYGIAHVGVLKALEEFDVPIDVVGGTSMGAIFAGGLARGWSADTIMDHVRRLFSSRFALYDPTIPVQALLAGRKLDRVLRGLFEDVDFADLWAPLFCVSTNITSGRAEVHTTGNMWSAIRSSCSIPGLFPPFPALRQLLVDGGLVDNLPLDVMVEQCPGPIIAVDVWPYRCSKGHATRPATGMLRGLRRLGLVSPNVFDILAHATFAGSEFRTERSLASNPPALYLVPPLERHRLLDWRAYEALYRAGYDAARQELGAGKLPRSLWEGGLEHPPVG
jgi:predicted acylesterase/phospholipase RssA/CRP-like cAMP-binding protein